MYTEEEVRAALKEHLSAQKGLDQADVWALTNRIVESLRKGSESVEK